MVDEDGLNQLVQAMYPDAKLRASRELVGGLNARTVVLEIGLEEAVFSVVARWPLAHTLRRQPKAASHDFQTLRLTKAAGLPVPAPLYLDESIPCLIMEYVEGRTQFSPQDSADYLRQFAQHLAAIHRIDASPLTHLPIQTESFAHWLANPPAVLDERMGEPEVRRRLLQAWPLPMAEPLRLLHGDFWPGNLLWRDGELVAVLDWEMAKLGEPLFDLAVCRLDTLWVFGELGMQTLTDQYQMANPLDLAMLPYWDLFASLRPMGHLREWAAVYPHLGRPDITELTMREGHQNFVRQAMAKVG